MSSVFRTLLDGTAEDCTTALMVSLDRLSVAAKSAGDLLRNAGFAGSQGDTADDLHRALAVHTHLLHQFEVKIRTAESTDFCTVTARTSQGAYAAAADRQGDTPFGISVTPAGDRAHFHSDLAAAHKDLRISGSLSDALMHPTLSIAIQSYARRRRRSTPSTDFKRQAANDRD